MLCRSGAAIAPISKGSELMPFGNKPKSLRLMRIEHNEMSDQLFLERMMLVAEQE